MRAETSATSAVATLSVAVAVAGHVLVGGFASVAVVPQLLALAAIAWLLGEHLTARRWLSIGVLAAIQLTTHLILDSGHRPAPMDPAPMDHAAMVHSSMHDMAGMTMPMPEPVVTEQAAGGHGGLASALTMSAAHLAVLLVGVALVTQAHRWVQRVLRILARLVPQVPALAIALPVVRAVLAGVPERPQLTQRWLTSNVSRRGPPEYGAFAALY
ncbi:hypothetical protein [Streptomyces sp. SID13031]|uniref:hypothetical protein n=1 Tax=Streptomyces sp. SID13031 TaxID=2706046 RepID=UPI0013CBDD78|nr:hypothetical protein [Streptomyces sp. SID13031]NEA37493.1 hypothetical protein [Streptomyces sp. SID13031]